MAQSAAQRRASLKNLKKARRARRKNPANPTRRRKRARRNPVNPTRKHRRRARRHNPVNPTRRRHSRRSRRSNPRRSHRGYRRRNPVGMTGTTIALTFIGGFLGYESTNFVDRLIATRTPANGVHPWYYSDAIVAIAGQPDGMRYAAAIGQAVGSGLLAYWAHKRHMERTSYLFTGWAFGSGLWIANVVYLYKIAGKLFVAGKNEEKIGNQVYPDWQTDRIAAVDAVRDAMVANAATDIGQAEPLAYAGGPRLAGVPSNRPAMPPSLSAAPAYGCGGTSGCGPSCGCDSCRQKRDRDADAQYVRTINEAGRNLAGNRPRRVA